LPRPRGADRELVTRGKLRDRGVQPSSLSFRRASCVAPLPRPRDLESPPIRSVAPALDDEGQAGSRPLLLHERSSPSPQTPVPEALAFALNATLRPDTRQLPLRNAMKEGPLGETLPASTKEPPKEAHFPRCTLVSISAAIASMSASWQTRASWSTSSPRRLTKTAWSTCTAASPAAASRCAASSSR
jgi:hypothetical protein